VVLIPATDRLDSGAVALDTADLSTVNDAALGGAAERGGHARGQARDTRQAKAGKRAGQTASERIATGRGSGEDADEAIEARGVHDGPPGGRADAAASARIPAPAIGACEQAANARRPTDDRPPHYYRADALARQ
jgi:hypothetical protein